MPSFQPRLDRVEPGQDPGLLSEQARQQSNHRGEEPEGDEAQDGERALGGREGAEPACGASPRIAPSGADDERGQGAEGAVPGERPPADRRGVKLAEAAARGPLAPRETAGDHGREREEQAERSEPAPPRGRARHQGGRDRQLDHGEGHGERRRQSRGQAEAGEGLAGAGSVQELGDAGDGEDGRQNDAGAEEGRVHVRESTSRGRA